jgi:DNA-binding transcriptional ArsR family regulator
MFREMILGALAPVAYARRTDPDTAHAAAASLRDSEALARLNLMVCDILADHPKGLTTVEIARKGRLGRDSVSPRMPALVEAGLVEDSGQRRVPAGKRRSSIVWRTRV